nr:hypothetical protein [Pseudomonadota bacterium]
GTPGRRSYVFEQASMRQPEGCFRLIWDWVQVDAGLDGQRPHGKVSRISTNLAFWRVSGKPG